MTADLAQGLSSGSTLRPSWLSAWHFHHHHFCLAASSCISNVPSLADGYNPGILAITTETTQLLPHLLACYNMPVRPPPTRLRYYGPSYIFQNWNNTGRCFPLTPYCYSAAACRRLYEATAAEVKQVERELQQRGQQAPASAPAGTAA